ncbi:MAG: DNA repair protein RecN [Kiritimatiellae bacterium]|nr:DNA repair protein RecN [Kiritimatiellia bacterium]
MLQRLIVRNLAIVQFAEVEFASGLNVLTGETGAGKSVLMGALELVMGGRAESSIVRDGESEARVEAEFLLEKGELKDVAQELEEAGLPPCEDGILTVRRTVNANGGGRTWVNDSTASAGTLKKLAKRLLDIHGARANQKILEERFQREALDDFGDVEEMLERAKYAEAWEGRQKTIAAIKDLEGEGDTDEELDMLRYQVNELDEANLSEEDETIAERQRKAASMEDVRAAASEATEALGGEDQSVAELLMRLQPDLRLMARNLPEASEWVDAAEEMCIKAQNLSREIHRTIMQLEGAEENLAELDARLTLVNRLKRKFKAATVEELLATLEKKRARMERLENREAELASLSAQLKELDLALLKNGEKVSERRVKAAGKIGKEVTKELHDLGFLQAKFEVRLERTEPGASGLDRVEYMFEPNPGESARELRDIASSGETARVMLALKSVLSAHDRTSVLVFDEIDANIGGEVGRAVGEKLRKVSRSHQVLAITHLPQSAVYGERHLVVSKRVEGGRTLTGIEQVEGAKRVEEIARMLGGVNLTSVTRKHAEELLNYGKTDR